ncbi:hypothetical protein FIBSPDRAFT_939643 [Athelia psychrophila]|uniref:Fungal-type protein kinase domain-containing protein n=1 Tax=Athelia psychrophila TaxID=1759441 RepID=A0A167XHI8_9AGAM|nr:hypothetical protein FIBSPDRAFT_939643 [Fibularhizoctonia sp. CBS 109695]
MMNVLLCPTDSPGQFRGVLTDLDLAGTRFYQSIHVLRAEGQHDHLDDLESFFYLFCMLCLGYSGPGQAIVPTPSVFHGWEMDRPEVAAGVKTGFVLSHRKRVEVSLVVSPSVKEVFSTVVASLRAFVMKKYLAKSERVEAQQDAARAGQERAPVAINKDFMAVADGEYTEFLGIIGEAIDELAQAETESSGAPDRLGVDLSDSTGYGPRSFAPVPEMPVASGSGNKRVSESEQSSQPPRKRSRLSKGRALPTSA